jgi:sucrose-6-phosphate hydrolase SacC (GH32 family)
MPKPRLRVCAVLAGMIASAAMITGPGAATARSGVANMVGADPVAGPLAVPTYRERYRPQFHFTPGKNWMNDPNGLVYYQGEYHMFYQYNPLGDVWGNMSWGHAISRDLVHWTELPVAIPFDEHETIFSGSVVIDKNNTSGFGTRANPPMVAIYSSAALPTFAQSQALAYSLDRGRTWTKYAGNPVLDHPDPDFRDPKVFWHEATQRWIMPVALSIQRKIQFYSSPNLKDWTLEGEFGPEGAIAGVYEVPNLIPLRVQGAEPATTKWLLIVNINPGARGGGSAAQFFIGDFDGHRFRADDLRPYTPPTGRVLADFEGSDYGAWRTTGTAFGTGPAHGGTPGQRPVARFMGAGFVNSRQPDEAAQGTLTSPVFTITRDYINFLVGGSDLPNLAGLPGTATINLLVGGRVVRSASGFGDEWLDWKSWNVRDLRGRSARIRIVDRAETGHILVDQITLAGRAATSSAARARWVDWGHDFYAAITFENVPGGRQPLVGWMNNWQYADKIPTAPWRSTQSEPRDLTLRRIGNRTELIQTPVRELRTLHAAPAYTVQDRTVTGTRTLAGPGSRGKALDIVATFDAGTADRFGLKVFVGHGQQTIIGYDTTTQMLYVDRRRSGDVRFHPQFASISRAPLTQPGNGQVKLRVLVDHSSVEVFADHGQRVITDQVFPGASSDRVQLFAEGGSATVRLLKMWRMESIWWPDPVR